MMMMRNVGGSGSSSVIAPDPAYRVTLALAREIYAGRRRRARFLASDLFGEPTWDILLDLYIAARENRRVPTTSACIGAHVPPTTALRWLRILEARGIVEREEDGRDGRRTFVRLSERGLTAMDGYLQGMVPGLTNAMIEPLREAEYADEAMAQAAE
ncbi:MAG: MarR family transcriptional regulator [Novosphingobium sp. 12-64-8]|nr:MAG: MarR family transcriptional regulator [Novosphingobium sp. 12-64-8]